MPSPPAAAQLDVDLPVLVPDASALANPPAGAVQLTWLGHASCFVQLGGANVLVDPIWSDRCGPVSFVGPKRYRPPPIAVTALPRVDAVFISHNHYDHLDLASVRAIEAAHHPHWFVPRGLGAWFAAEGIDSVVELSWWESARHGPLVVTATCASHWSRRALLDRDTTLWCSWAIAAPDAGTSFWFAGDTGYANETFAALGERYGPFTVAAIPIGAYDPRELMRCQHVDPAEAVALHRDVRAKRSVGIHWGTFVLTNEPILEPPVKLAAEAAAAGLAPDEFIVLKHGQSAVFTND